MTWRELAIYYDEKDRRRCFERAFLGACALGDTSLIRDLDPYSVDAKIEKVSLAEHVRRRQAEREEAKKKR